MSFALYKNVNHQSLKVFFVPALALKVLAGIALGLLFKYYYGFGDTLTYFNEACRYASITETGWVDYIKSLFDNSAAPFQSNFYNQPRALLISKITSVFALITYNNYWITSVYFSLIAFGGLWALACAVYRHFGNKLAVLLALFVFPSVVFWSAGISKESLSVAAVAWLVSSFINYSKNRSSISIYSLLLDVIALLLLWHLRYFYAGVLILSIVSGLVTTYISSKSVKVNSHPIYQFAIYVICGIVMTGIVSLTKYNFHIENIAGVIAKNHDALVEKSDPGEIIQFENIDGTFISIIKNSPEALFSGLFRPLPSDGSGLFFYLSQFENSVILLLFLTCLLSIKEKTTSSTRILLFTGLCYCAILATFLALSTPNFGSLVRYKVGFLPILLLIITINNPLIKRLNDRLFT
ncbi:MAG: hypothetical protein ABJH05_14735 [Fulvivirga sp.]